MASSSFRFLTVTFGSACASGNVSVEVVAAEEDFLGDGAAWVGAAESARVDGELLSVDGELVALEVGFEVEGAGADGAGVAADVFAVDVCAGWWSVMVCCNGDNRRT